MSQILRPTLVIFAALSVLTGLIYPAVVTGIAQVAFPTQANGSLICQGDAIVGSTLVGQQFSKPEYFWGRLSATGPVPYNASASSGSNLGPLNPALKANVEGRIAALKEAGSPTEGIPVDLVTASGSGLDPHISPAAAEFQVARVARARNLAESKVRELVAEHTQGRQLGILGEPTVNVLELNLALDAAK